MKGKHTQFILTSAIILGGFVAVFLLSNVLETSRVSAPASYSDEDLSLQGKRLKGYALGAEGLIADWYWMRSLQYIGNKVETSTNQTINIDDLRPLNPRLLYPLLDNATALDPTFIPAYSYGATVLPAIDPAQAIALTEKGIANNPDQWRLYQYLGYIYWRLGNYPKAAEVYEKGASIIGAPSFMEIMAARMKTQGGSRETAREMYVQMLAQADDAQTKVTAQNRLMQLDSLDDRDAINAVLKAFAQKRGRCADNWRELLALLRDVKLPHDRDFSLDPSENVVDPSGAPYVLNKETCSVELDPGKTKIALDEK